MIHHILQLKNNLKHISQGKNHNVQQYSLTNHYSIRCPDSEINTIDKTM